jgi:DNA repair protein SbcD/Mre11
VKILHTADWHVGRPIRGRSRAEEHQAVLTEIADIARQHEVDVVIVAGDLFDTATPTPESERIVWTALMQLAGTGATVVVLSGNHDNDRRLQAVAPLLFLARVVVRPIFATAENGGVVELFSRDGAERAKLACVPFLSQRWVVRAAELVADDAATHQLQYGERMRLLVKAVTNDFTDTDTIFLAAAHSMVLGAELTGSERQGQSVFEYSVSSSAFPPSVQYVALGHLHRQQSVAGPVPMYYSGSPLQLDFGETRDQKGVLLVDVKVGQPAVVRPIPLTTGRRLRVVEGTLAELRHAEVGDDWVKAVVRELAAPGLAEEVREILPNAVDVVVAASESAAQRCEKKEIASRSPQDLFSDFLAERAIEPTALSALFSELYDEVLEQTL